MNKTGARQEQKVYARDKKYLVVSSRIVGIVFGSYGKEVFVTSLFFDGDMKDMQCCESYRCLTVCETTKQEESTLELVHTTMH